MKAKKGLRIHVFSGDHSKDLGLGTIKEVESNGYPSKIVLDSGEVTEGCKCWWHKAIKGVTPNF